MVADGGRSPVRPGPHWEVVRLSARRDSARRRAARQGPCRGRADRGLPRTRSRGQGVQAGNSRFHVRRQSARLCGGPRDACRDRGGRSHEERRAHRRDPARRAARGARGTCGRSRGTRSRPDDRRRARPALRRSGRAGPGGGPAHQRHHGQGDPPAAAARDERRRSPPGAFHPRSAGALVPLAARPGDARTRMKKAQARLRHYLQFKDFSRGEYEHLFARTRWIKDKFKRYERYWPLEDRTLAMIFEKPSTRTRLSFEAGMHQLGGAAIYLYTRDSQLGRGEPVEDAGQVISRMCDLVMIRTFEQQIIERFASHSRVPVINGLTDEYHPCQVLADIYTYVEHRGSIRGKTVAWIGDSNNVCSTWLQAAAIFDFNVHVSTPPGYEVDPNRAGVGELNHMKSFSDPLDGCRGADLVTTDVWTSMGFETENAERRRNFEHWKVDRKMMAAAKPDAGFMH